VGGGGGGGGGWGVGFLGGLWGGGGVGWGGGGVWVNWKEQGEGSLDDAEAPGVKFVRRREPRAQKARLS